MAYRYELNVYVAEQGGKSCSAIDIKGFYKKETQSRRVISGFGFDGIQKAVDKSLMLALAHCKNLNSNFIINMNKPHSEDNPILVSYLSRTNKIDILINDHSMFLKYVALTMLGKEETKWQDITQNDTILKNDT